jgi:hypothetical protein
MPQHPVQATNAILVSGEPIIEEYEVEDCTNMYPGMFVITGTAAHQVKVATDSSDKVIGILDVMADENRADMYTDSRTYVNNQQVRVLRGDCVVMARVDHAAVITVGMKVEVSDATGSVAPYATANCDVGIAEEAHAAAALDGWLIVHLQNV